MTVAQNATASAEGLVSADKIAARQTSTCDFCGTATPLDLEDDARGSCLNCGASWRDRALLEQMMAFECLPGAPSYRRLCSFLEEKGRKIAVIGRLFDRADTDLPGIIHRFSPEQLVSKGRGKPKLPVMPGALDYLIVQHAHHMVVPLAALSRALAPGGVMIVTEGFPWPLPPKGTPIIPSPRDDAPAVMLGEDPIAEARASGMTAWFERPAMGTHVLQRQCVLVLVTGLNF